LCAALVLAIDPLLITYSSLVLTKALFALFLAWLVLLLWRPTQNRWMRGLVSGLLLGATTLTRPVSLFLSIVLVIGYLILERRHLRSAAIVVLSFMIGFGMVGGWIIRNDVMGGVATVSTIEAQSALLPRRRSARGGPEPSARQGVLVCVDAAPSKAATASSVAQVYRAEDSIAKTIIVIRAVGYGKEVIAVGGRWRLGRVATSWFPPSRAMRPALSTPTLISTWSLYVLAAVGLWAAWRERQLHNCLMPFVVILYLAVVSSGLDAYSRFRLPIMPFLALLAGLGAVAIVRPWSEVSPGLP